MSFQTWLENTHYPRGKRESLARLYHNTVVTGNTDLLLDNTEVKCFGKDEPYDRYKHPRGIYARPDEFKIRVGPIFKAIEEKVFSREEFVKKVPVCDRAKLIRDLFGEIPGLTDTFGVGLRFLSTDYTAFESSFTKEFFLVCEYILYEYMVSNIPEGKFFLKLILKTFTGKNLCKYRNISAFVNAGRMSGEMNTSLGNGFSNLMLFLFMMRDYKCKNFKCLIEGDDCLASYVGPYIPSSAYADFGFTIKMDYLLFPNLASFCGQLFDFSSLTVISDPIKIILNFGWTHVMYRGVSARKRLGLIRAKALSLLYQYPGCPILQSLALCMIRLTNHVKWVCDVTMDRYKRNILRQAVSHKQLPVRHVTMEARLFMFQIYGITVSDQLSLESYFYSYKAVQPIEHPVIYHYCSPVWFHYNLRYVSDLYGSDVINYEPLGALNKSLKFLKDVL